jgi:hypothetical protein
MATDPMGNCGSITTAFATDSTRVVASSCVVSVRVEFTNAKAARALKRVLELADEMADDQPWNDNAKEMLRAARYAAKHVRVANA